MLDLITVVFREELPLLKIQAESIHQYISTQDINSITIIVNDTDDVADLIDTSWWQQHQDRVQIKCYSKWDYACRITGWENQQICKLLGAAESIAEWSMVLDAKTWFIRPLELTKLFSNGKPNTGFIPVMEVFNSSRQFVENLYNTKLDLVLGPGGVPFMFHTATVQELVNSIDNFVEFFQTNVKYPNLVTEFHLYSGYVLHKFGSYETLYNKTQYYQVVNIADYEAPAFDVLFKTMSSKYNILTVSIHRRTYKDLVESQIDQWFGFLKDKSVIHNELETKRLINTYT